jgi:chromosome segregation ATPase
MVEESDIKYDEVARKLAMVEGDLERAEERAEGGESKIVDLEEELRVIGENLKALEVAEEKAQQREEEYKKQVKSLNIVVFLLIYRNLFRSKSCWTD